MGIGQMMFGSLVLLLACNTIIVHALKNECPPDNYLSECSCSEFFFKTYLTCDKNTEKGLKSDLTSLRGFGFDEVTVKNVVLNNYYADFFKGMGAKKLELNNVSLIHESLKENVPLFEGLEDSLESLIFLNGHHMGSPLTYAKLDHLKKLESLTMDDNKIAQVGNDWFTNGPDSLTAISMERNDIKLLGDKAFSALKNLERLLLSGNSFIDVSRSMLPFPAAELREIDLSSNQILSLPSDLFQYMPSLRTVSLNNNLITRISEDTWPASLRDSARLNLAGNPLICDDNLKWICDIDTDMYTAKCENPSTERGKTVSKFCGRWF